MTLMTIAVGVLGPAAVLCTTGCANMFLGYGELKPDAPYAALRPRDFGGPSSRGQLVWRIDGPATLHDASPDGKDKAIRLEHEDDFSLLMAAVNLFPLSIWSVLWGEVSKPLSYRLPPGDFRLTVPIRWSRSESGGSGAGHFWFRDLGGGDSRGTYSGTAQAGRVYYFTPKEPDRVFTHTEWDVYMKQSKNLSSGTSE